MKDKELGTLFEKYAALYGSVPLYFVCEQIAERHPDVTADQFKRIIRECRESIFRYHCWILKEGPEEPQLVAEHLLALGGDDYDRFMAARIDGPCCSYEEEDIFRYTAYPPDIPEAKAIDRFGRTELGLDEEWSEQLVMDCIFEFGNALVENHSWVRTVLDSEQFGNIKFRTIEQVRTYRDLGNKLYQVMPNPVLKGFRPMDLENAPAIPDAIPDRVQDIPDSRGRLEELCAPFGGREKAAELFLNALSSSSTAPKKIRRKDPCPCGSGKKYKNCHGKNLS